jgi:hypothetical protein
MSSQSKLIIPGLPARPTRLHAVDNLMPVAVKANNIRERGFAGDGGRLLHADTIA